MRGRTGVPLVALLVLAMGVVPVTAHETPTSTTPSMPAATGSPASTGTPPTATPPGATETPAPPPMSTPPTATETPAATGAPTATATAEATATVAPVAPESTAETTAPAAPVAPEATAPAAPAANRRPDPRGRYIVVLEPGADTAAVVGRHHRRHGTTALQTFDRVFRGFTARLDDAQRRALLADPTLDFIVPDARVELASQVVPTGVARVGARPGATTTAPVDADVALIDTGLARHPDLRVAGGYSCASADRSAWRDRNGHGTHVAGTVGALDNGFGVVGVAPGARLWGVRVLDDTGEGLLSWWVCGLEWVLAQRDPTDSSRPLFEVVNMSITKWGSDDHACGSVNHDVVHAAVCRLVRDGTTVVVAAANDHGPASKRIPAAYNEVITVSALADTDGKPGGLGGRRCYSWGTYDKDDTFADFSNYGADVDLIAPGKCIWSTLPSAGYGYVSGTSMATPAVSGAVARYKATRPRATPAEVKEALQYLGNLGWYVSTDPDSRHEKLLGVSRIAKLGSFALVAPSGPRVIEAGSTVSVPISIKRSSTFFERVRFAVGGVPAGWTVRVSPSTLMGWTATATSLVVSVPASAAVGTSRLAVTGTNQGRVRSIPVDVVVTNDTPTAKTPSVRPAPLATVGVTSALVPSSVKVRVRWSAATDPSSPIVGYEVQRRVDGGPWSASTSVAGSRRYLDVAARSLGATHRFRLRARDAVGHWSPWVESVDYRFGAVSDRSRSIRYAGTWRRASAGSATDGVRTTSVTGGALAQTQVTGLGVALVMPRSSVRGKVWVYVDGVRVATVDTYAGSVQPRRIVWATAWAARGTHQLAIKVAGTPGRPTVSLDGLIITN